MAHRSRQLPLLTMLVCLVVLGFVRGSAEETAEKQDIDPELLIPLLSSALDGPTFIATIKNRGDEAVSVGQLKAESVCVLDGKDYPCRIAKVAGRDSVGPKETREFILTLSHYVSSAVKSGYSEKLQRWRWKSNLALGRHTVSFRFGGEKLGPLTFFWDAETPLLYE